MLESPRPEALVVATRAGDSEVLPPVDRENPLAFVRAGRGIIGHGVAAVGAFSGASRITDAAAWWTRTAALSSGGDHLVAVGSFAFADDSAATSVLIIPSSAYVRRGEGTTIVDAATAPGSESVSREAVLEVVPSTPVSESDFREAVTTAISRMGPGAALQKVVLARAVEIPGAPVRAGDLFDALAALGGDSTAFAVAGLVGSSPETLVSVDRGLVRARVLAGTAMLGSERQLVASDKDQREHAAAVASVVDALAPLVDDLSVPDQPSVLTLPSLLHLASDVTAQLLPGLTVLDLVAALHPTAAVAGTPRVAALSAITELEPFDRGRFSGPVGWVDAQGNGEWAIALRCGTVDSDGAVLAYAGAGIMPDSSPDAEAAETELKLSVMRSAMSSAMRAPTPSQRPATG